MLHVFNTLSSVVCSQMSVPESQKKEPQRKESHLHPQNEASAAVASQSDCFTQRNSLFNKEALQVKCCMHTQHHHQQLVMVHQRVYHMLHQFELMKSCTFLFCVPSYNWKLIKCSRRVCFFHPTFTRICRWSFKIKPQ